MPASTVCGVTPEMRARAAASLPRYLKAPSIRLRWPSGLVTVTATRPGEAPGGIWARSVLASMKLTSGDSIWPNLTRAPFWKSLPARVAVCGGICASGPSVGVSDSSAGGGS